MPYFYTISSISSTNHQNSFLRHTEPGVSEKTTPRAWAKRTGCRLVVACHRGVPPAGTASGTPRASGATVKGDLRRKSATRMAIGTQDLQRGQGLGLDTHEAAQIRKARIVADREVTAPPAIRPPDRLMI